MVGFVLILLAVMFRPSGAVADLPTRANVYVKYSDSEYATVEVSKLSQVTREFDIVPTKKKTPVKSNLTGVPLIEFLKAVDADLSDVAFARVRLNTTDDSRLALVPLGEPTADRPPLVLSSGKVGSRSLGTPSLVPGQPEADQPIHQENIVGFSKSKPYIEIIPAQPGAKILGVKISKKRLKSGQYSMTAKISNGSGKPAKYQWFQTDAKGNQAKIGSDKTVTTSATGTKEVVVSVVATETGTGSTGLQYSSYVPKSSDSGSTKNPGGSGGGSGGGTTTGNGTGSGTPGGTGTITTAPVPYVAPTTPTTPSIPTTPTIPQPDTPTASTGVSPTIDTTAITNAAQNVEGSGGMRVVSGVLLSAPTAAPAAGGGGSPLSVLPAPVASELNSIFQPVESTDDVWVYLLAVLFAFWFSGAVREWVKP
jgi:hypothetical protein